MVRCLGCNGFLRLILDQLKEGLWFYVCFKYIIMQFNDHVNSNSSSSVFEFSLFWLFALNHGMNVPLMAWNTSIYEQVSIYQALTYPGRPSCPSYCHSHPCTPRSLVCFHLGHTHYSQPWSKLQNSKVHV